MSKLLLSIVIPAFNEEKYLPECLKSIKLQNYKGKLNIIISDNGSIDKTLAIAKKFNCFVVRDSKKGNIASARSFGYQKALELARKFLGYKEILINIDADTIMVKNYLATVASVFSNKRIAAASGPFIIDHPQIPFKKYGEKMVKLHYLACLLDLRLPWLFFKMWNNTYLYGANFCLRRSVFEKVGGWDERFIKAEDLALSLKLLKTGYKIKFVDGLAVKTSLRKFVNAKGNISVKKAYEYLFKDKKLRKSIKLARKVFK